MIQLQIHKRIAALLSCVVALGWAPVCALQVTQLTFGSADPSFEAYQSEPAWSPNGALVAYSSSSWQAGNAGGEAYLSLGIVTPSGTAGPAFAPPVWIQYHPTWSRDGTRIAFAGGSGLSSAPIADYNDVAALVLQGVQSPSWSPAEDRIAFESNGQLAVIPAGGGIPAPLPTPGGHNPAWSPDGSKLAYDSGGQIWILDLSQLTTGAITVGATSDVHPTWSPDGGWIAFASRRSGSRALWVVAATGGAPIQLTLGATNDFDPAWSPDGNSIAFTSERGGAGPHLWIASDLPDFTVPVEQKSWSDMKALYRP